MAVETEVKPAYKKELANAYGLSMYHIRAMLRKTREHLQKKHGEDVFGEYKGRCLLTIKQVTLLYQHNGMPGKTISE